MGGLLVRFGSSRALAAIFAALVLSEGIFVQPVAASPTRPPAQTAPYPAADPKTDEPVTLDPADEIVAERTATSRTYDLGDGQYAVEAFADPIFYQPEGSTAFEPIDLDFRGRDKGATASVTASPVRVEVGAQADGLVRLAFDGHEITLRPLPVAPANDAPVAELLEGDAPALEADTTLPADAAPVALDAEAIQAALAEPIAAERPAPDQQRVDIAGVLPGVDLRVFAHANGTSNFLVLAARPVQTSWTFAITAPGLTLTAGKDGALAFVDAMGTTIATMPAPYAVDSTPDEFTGSGRTTTAAWYTLSALGDQQLVTVSVDPAWLEQSVYPVYVDPSVTVYNDGTSANGDVHVNEGNPTFHYYNYQRPDSPYYYEMWLGESPSDSTYFNMAFMQFALAAYEGYIVDSASLEVRPYHQYYDAPTSTRTYLRRVTESWVEDITWNTRPSVNSTVVTYSDCVEGEQCAFDITDLANDWFDGDKTDYGIRLDEIDTNNNRKGPTYWKRLIASEQGTSTRPRVILAYHNPAAPAYPSGGPTSSRTLTWTTDTWTTTSGYSVQVATDTAFTNIVASSGSVTGSAAKGWAIPSTTSLTPGTTYYWRVKIARTGAASGTRWSEYSTYASFAYDPDANLGSLGYNTYESFDLGGGDSLMANVSTGNLVLSHSIVNLPIRGGSLPIGVTFNSFDTTDGGLGAGWRLNLQRSVSVSGTNATFTDADGARHVFTGASTAGTVTTWTRPATIYASLRRDTAQTGQEITLTYRDQSKDTFRASDGRLVKSEDRFGNAVTYGYTGTNLTSIADPASRTVTVGWNTGVSPNRLTSITDWAIVDSAGIVQPVGGSGYARKMCFVYGTTLTGWTDPLYAPTSACPTSLAAPASHATTLTYGSGLLTSISKYQTVTTLSGTTLGTGTQTAATTIGYRGNEVASVQGPSQASTEATTITRTAPSKVVVWRVGAPNVATSYTLQSATDNYGRVASANVQGHLHSTTWNATYPTEPASITDDDGFGVLTRTVTYSYQASSMGLLATMTEPLDGTYSRLTTYTYNSNNDLTQKVADRSPTGGPTAATTTRYCYTTSGCSITATDLLLRSTIENYIDGTAGNGVANVEDIVTSYSYDAYGQQTLELRNNYKTVAGVNTLLDQRANGKTYNSDGTIATSVANHVSGTVTSPGDDVTPNATTGARTDLTTTYTYDSAGNQASVADPRRAIALALGATLLSSDYVTAFTYDALGQQRSETTPTTPGITITQQTSSMTYDELGNLRTSIDLGGLQTATEYDAASRPTRTIELAAGSSTAIATQATTYDASGRVLTARDRRQIADLAHLGETQYSYDDHGQQDLVAEGGDAILGDGITPESSTTITYRDGLDRVTCVRFGWTSGPCQTLGGSTQATITTYDVGGRVLKVDDQFSCTTRTYDYRDLALTETTGLAGNGCTSTADVRTVTNSFDGLGRPTRSEVTSGTGTGDRSLDVTRDGAGRQLTSASKTSGTTLTTTYTLNPLDQTLAEAPADGSTTKTTYDAAGNVTDTCYWKPSITAGACLPVGTTPWTNPPTQSTTTTYDARNQRVSLANASTNSTTTYDPDHNYQPAAFYLPTGSGKEHQILYGYDTRHRLTSLTQQLCTISAGHSCSAMTATGSDTYAYDDNDNRTQVAESNGATSSDHRYCYDALNRLIYRNSGAACSSSAKDEAYTYDEAGNRTTTVLGGVTNTFAYTTGQLTGCTTSCSTVSHDTGGNVSRLGSWSYEYDQEGRLTKACKAASCATGNPDRVEFTYDGEGHRTEERRYTAGTLSTTIGFRYQGDAIVEETTNGTISRSYLVDDAGTILRVCDPTCSAPVASYLPVWNGHGDATALYRINGDGSLTLANSYLYDTWGAPTTATHNSIADLGFRFMYVGAHDVQWDNAYGIGLAYMHARHYSPIIGRFLQPDPARAETNVYVYSENSPSSKTDPDGLRTITIVANSMAGGDFELRYIRTLARFGWTIEGVHVYEKSSVRGYKRGRFIDVIASKNGYRVRIELKTGSSKYLDGRQFLHDVKKTLQTGTPTRVVRYSRGIIRSTTIYRAGRGWGLFFGGGGHSTKMK